MHMLLIFNSKSFDFKCHGQEHQCPYYVNNLESFHLLSH